MGKNTWQKIHGKKYKELLEMDNMQLRIIAKLELFSEGFHAICTLKMEYFTTFAQKLLYNKSLK
jgi:hypothetical protein